MYKVSSQRTSCTLLRPHPRWRWAGYPVRWLLGGCLSLWRLPLHGSLYGTVFFAVVWAWAHALRSLDGAGIALATALTGVTLLLVPRLTAGLLESGPLYPVSAEDEALRNGALIGLGALLLMVLSFSVNSGLAVFALLYTGDVPRLDGLAGAVFSWSNAPLAMLLLGLWFLAALSLQMAAVLPTFLLLRQSRQDLFVVLRASLEVVRINWRPLACWSLASQVLLVVGYLVLPVSLVLLAPLIACGTWWACRDMLRRSDG